MNYKISYDTWNKEEIRSITNVVKSGNYTMGENVKKFEKTFSKKIGVKYSVMTNSGSSANLIGVASQFFLSKNNLKRGDEVLVPALGWSTTYSPLGQYGLKLKIIDVSIDDLNINYEKLKKAITKKTKMICVINLLGIPCNLSEIRKLCDSNKIILYEDNCESLGAILNNNKKTGTFGDFSTHSFFFSHHISTIEGGMVSTNNFEIYNILKCLRAHGWTRDLDVDSKISKRFSKDFESAYKFLLPGYNVRPNEINAAIGLEQIKKLDNMVKIRRKNLEIFQKYFLNDDRFIIPKTVHKSSSFAFPMILKKNNKNERNIIFKRLTENKIEHRLIAGGNFALHPHTKFYDFKIYNNLKNADKAHKSGFCVGNSSINLSKEIKFLYDILS